MSENKALKEEFVNFTQTTTLHGLSKVTDNTKRASVRFVWFLAVMLMLGIYMLMLCTTLISYFDHPTVTSVELQSNASFEFPSVSICNVNYARRSAILANNSYLSLFKMTVPDNDLPDPVGPVLDFAAIDPVKCSMDVSHQPEDMYLECGFDGIYETPCRLSNRVRWRRTPDGFCHTFNSVRQISRYGPLVSTRAGGKYGLILVINIEQYDYYQTSSNGSGVQVLVHPPDAVPDIQVMGFAVSPGMETLASIKKTIVKRLPEPYSKYPNVCIDTKASNFENPLAYFRTYTEAGCRRECRINYELKMCGCASHINDGANFTWCDFPRFLGCSQSAAQAYDADPTVEAACDCHPVCEETVYDVSVSSRKMPNEKVKEELVRDLNVPQITEENIDQNLIVLKIFFGELRYTMIEQKAQYTVTSLLGELGGQLGLCLGASVLTIAELVQFMETALRFLCTRAKKRTVQTSAVQSVGPEQKATEAWGVTTVHE